MKLTLVELTDLLAASTSTSKRVCELFLRELFATVSQELIDGHSVSIKNVGTFKVVESKSRKQSDDSTVPSAGVAERRRITFTPAKSLADAVNQPFAQFETVILDDAVTDEQLQEIDDKYPSVAFDSPFEENPVEPTEKEQPAAIEKPEPSEPSVSPEISEPSEKLENKENEENTDKSDELETSEKTETPHDNPPLERKPMLVGIPIDGPSHPVPQQAPVEEPKVDEYFHRPALRDAYSPTQEQLSAASSKRDLKWLWGVLGLLVIGGLLWLLLGRQGETTTPEPTAVESAEVIAEESEVVTDTVTSQIVLSTLSEKHYGSPWFWVYIYEENKDIISNPDNVRPGTTVVIPPAEKYGIDAKDPASLKKAQRRSWEILKLGKR